METVLIIEDDPTMLIGLKDNFEFKGYKVLTAADGEKGLKAALNSKPDLILLDVSMPIMDGLETLARLKAAPELAAIPVIMLTSRADHAVMPKLATLGARDTLMKPFSEAALLEKIRRIIALRPAKA